MNDDKKYRGGREIEHRGNKSQLHRVPSDSENTRPAVDPSSEGTYLAIGCLNSPRADLADAMLHCLIVGRQLWPSAMVVGM